jgi:hypothetical protein
VIIHYVHPSSEAQLHNVYGNIQGGRKTKNSACIYVDALKEPIDHFRTQLGLHQIVIQSLEVKEIFRTRKCFVPSLAGSVSKIIYQDILSVTVLPLSSAHQDAEFHILPLGQKGGKQLAAV